MPEFAKGLKLEVTDRDKLDEYIKDHTTDPATHSETWHPNSVPTTLYIVELNHDENPYYTLLYEYINQVVNTGYVEAELIEDMIDEGILQKEGYDIEFIDSNM